MNGFGKPVSTERQVDALDYAVEVLGIHPGKADRVIRHVADLILEGSSGRALGWLESIASTNEALHLLSILCTP
jgi:hypothetical protein